MTGALACAALLAVFYCISFGFTRLLLRNTTWDQYSLDAPWLAGTPLVVLCLSLLGYHEPYDLPVWHPWLLVLAWSALSLGVAIAGRVARGALVRTHWKRSLLVTLPACLGSGMMLWFFPGNEWDHISIPWISEYLNYAELGAVLTGHHHSEQGTPVYGFCAQHHELRWGQDVILAAVAQITVRHPLQAIIPLAVLFRFQYAIGLGLIVCAMVPARNWKWAAAVLALDAILLTELLSFSCSFFSSNCTAPLFMIYLVWLARLQAFHVREALVVVLMNLFFLLTYPEFLIVAKAFEAMSFFLA